MIFKTLEEIPCASVEATLKAGSYFIQSYASSNCTIILLEGDLGAGKTHFAKGLATGLGIDANVNSPTFNLLNRYEQNRNALYHYDLYRLPDNQCPEEFLEYWETGTPYDEEKAVHAIEWWLRAQAFIPAMHTIYKVNLKFDGETKRKLTFSVMSEH